MPSRPLQFPSLSSNVASAVDWLGARGGSLAPSINLGLFCLILAWAPLPLGSNRPWSWSFLVLAIAAVALLVALQLIVRRQPHRLPLPVGLAGLAFLGVAGWAFLQMQPALIADWVHPAWAVLADFTGDASGGGGAITLDLDATRDALMRLLGYIGAFVVAYSLARDAEAARWLMLVILCTTTLVSAYGLFMVFGGNELLPFLTNAAYRHVVTGSFVNRNSFATYANLGVVIGFVWLFEPFLRDLDRRELKVLLRELLQRLMGERGLFLVALLILATASLLTASRGGFLSIAAGLLVILCLLFLLTRPRLPALAIATPLIAAAVWGLVSVSGSAVLERFEQTSDARIDIWAVTREMIEDRFWLGHGYGTYEPAFNAYRDDRFPKVVDKAHNTYLEHATELGIPATLLLYTGALLLVLQCVAGVFRRRRDKIYPLIAVAATTVVAVHAVVDFSLQIPAIAVTYATIMGIGCAQSMRSEKKMRGK